MPNSGKISVEALSIISHGGCHVYFYTTPKTLRKRFSDWLFCEVDSISDNAFMLTPDATLNGVLLDPTHAATKKTDRK